MSEKAECPACKAYTSGVYAVLSGDKEACPYCGLPAAAMFSVLEARKRGADKELTEKYEQAVIRAAKAEAELAKVKRTLDNIRAEIEDYDEGRTE